MNEKYTTVYFDLTTDEEGDHSIEAEEQGLKEAIKLLAPFSEGGVIYDEGHWEGVLVCKILIKKEKLVDLQAMIDADPTSYDDIIGLYSGYEIRGFSIVDNPGTDPGIPFDHWDEYIEAFNKTRVIIEIRIGEAYLIQKPVGIEVIIKDFDTEGSAHDGPPPVISTWERSMEVKEGKEV